MFGEGGVDILDPIIVRIFCKMSKMRNLGMYRTVGVGKCAMTVGMGIFLVLIKVGMENL